MLLGVLCYLPSNLMRQVVLLSPFYRWGNWKVESLSNLPKRWSWSLDQAFWIHAANCCARVSCSLWSTWWFPHLTVHKNHPEVLSNQVADQILQVWMRAGECRFLTSSQVMLWRHLENHWSIIVLRPQEINS